VATARPPTNAKARTSLTLGLLSLVLTVLTGPLAVLLGTLALRELRRGAGRRRGKGLALAGIGTGLAGTALGAWLLAAVVEAVRDASGNPP
jgi:hypothetical protein